MVSNATCAICSDEGTPFEPMSASTLSSVTSFLAFLPALVASEPSSRMMYLTGSPPRVFGTSWNAFL